MSGSLSIPNTFATASGNVAASQIDTDFTTVRDYINNREITVGLIGGRPAAGISGRYYFATDTGLGYVDTGSAWVQISNTGVGISVGAPRVQGLVGVNNTGAPTTKYDFSADYAVVRNPSDGTIVVREATGTLTNDTGAASAANGRDQAGAFTASTFVHFYFIWNGTTLASLSSATAPTTGPTLPATYTHWAYAGAVYFNGSSQLVVTRMAGHMMYYGAAQAALAGGNAVAETGVSVATLVPANALDFEVDCLQAASAACHIRVVTGVDFMLTTGVSNNDYWVMRLPNVGQQFMYFGGSGVAPNLSVSVQGYRVANGDS